MLFQPRLLIILSFSRMLVGMSSHYKMLSYVKPAIVPSCWWL